MSHFLTLVFFVSVRETESFLLLLLLLSFVSTNAQKIRLVIIISPEIVAFFGVDLFRSSSS